MNQICTQEMQIVENVSEKGITHKIACLFIAQTTTLPPTTIPPVVNETCEKFNEDVVGTPIKIVHNIDSWEHCAYLCYQDNKCQVWTWMSTGFTLKSAVGDCDLKDKEGGRRKVIGAVSGTSDCGKVYLWMLLCKTIFIPCQSIDLYFCTSQKKLPSLKLTKLD